MTVRVSYDEGKSWPVSKVIHEGPAAYSCLTRLPDGSIGLENAFLVIAGDGRDFLEALKKKAGMQHLSSGYAAWRYSTQDFEEARD